MCSENQGLYTVFLYRLSTNMWYLIVAIERVGLAERDSGAKSRRRVYYSKRGCVCLNAET